MPTSLADFNESAERIAPGLTQYRHAVITIHGMRTTGAWQKALTPIFQDNFIRHIPVDYDYRVASVCWPMTTSTISKVVDKVVAATEEHRLHCEAPPSVIAHSFGSLSIGRALKVRPSLTLTRAILFGCILPRDYPWSRIMDNGQIQSVLHEIGGEDPWPKTPFRRLIVGSGSAGRDGFLDLADGRVVERKNEWTAHSDLQSAPTYRKVWIPFLVSGSLP